jgi:hypothetical protein
VHNVYYLEGEVITVGGRVQLRHKASRVRTNLNSYFRDFVGLNIVVILVTPPLSRTQSTDPLSGATEHSQSNKEVPN